MSKATMPICVCGHASKEHRMTYRFRARSAEPDRRICMVDGCLGACGVKGYTPDFDRIRAELAEKGRQTRP